jgi:tripartite-type tricarboxylate transporter receptor subunit TctC
MHITTTRGRFMTLATWCLLVLVTVLFAQTSRSHAQDKDFFKGKTIRLIVSAAAGGGTDSAGRVMARFITKRLPGNPKIYVQNMPGGGGILGNNYFYKKAKTNGLDLFQASSSTVTQFNRGGKRIKYNPRDFIGVASINRGGSLIMIRKDVRHRLLDPKAEPVVVGDADGSRNWLAAIVWGNDYLNWNTRYIYGYSGTGEMALAFRQGEIEMMATANVPIVEDLIKDGSIEILATHGTERRRDYPNVKTFEELLGDKRPSGVSWQAYRFWSLPSELDKIVYLPKGTPANIVKMYRDAYQRMVKDPEFKDATTKFFGKGWVIRGAKATEELTVETTTATKEVHDFLRKVRKRRGLPTG